MDQMVIVSYEGRRGAKAEVCSTVYAVLQSIKRRGQS